MGFRKRREKKKRRRVVKFVLYQSVPYARRKEKKNEMSRLTRFWLRREGGKEEEDLT